MAPGDEQLPAWFQVYREELNRRLTAQDVKLDDIYTESRKTNGRIGKLETWRKEVDGHFKRALGKRASRYHVVEGVAMGACMIIGGVAGGVGHAAGWW